MEKTTEIDLLLLAPTGVYVFEVKYFSGTIYGGYDKDVWTEYYKTRDSITFENPLKQNEYHINQLKHLFPSARFYSYVVFTNPKGTMKVGGRYPGSLTVSNINDLTEKIRGDFAGREEIYTPEQIEKMFVELRRYSPMETDEKEYLVKGGIDLPFSSFAEEILQEVESEKQKARDSVNMEVQRQTADLTREREEIRKLKNEYQGLIKAAEEERDKAVLELEKFKKNFETVTPFTGDYGVINRDCFKAEVRFEKSDSFLNTVNMYFTFKNTSKELWIDTQNAWFLVGLKNGVVQKYILYKHLSGYSNGAKIDPGRVRYGSPLMIRLFNAPLEDICFIKLGNTKVTAQPISGSNVAPGVEFEVYVSSDVQSIYDYKDPKEISASNSDSFELNPEFMKTNISVESSTDGVGSDIKFSFEAGTEEVGFDLYTSELLIGCTGGSFVQKRIYGNVKNFYNHSIMPKTKTNTLTLHLENTKAEDIVFIKLKGLRVFRKELLHNDNLLPGVEFDIFHKE